VRTPLQLTPHDVAADWDDVERVVLLILIVSVLVVGLLSVLIGRWFQRKGTEMERNKRS
jgi:hypothetical protein